MLKYLRALAIASGMLTACVSADFAEENNLVLNGIATHQELRRPVFIAKLNTSHPVSTPSSVMGLETPAQMELVLLKRSWSGRQFRQYWLSGIAINAGMSNMNNHQDALLELATVLKSRMRENDRFTIDYLPNEYTRVSLNGVELQTFDADIWPLLVSNWVGPRVDQDFREAILTLPSNASDLIAQSSLEPTADRIADIESWLVAAEAVAEEVTEPVAEVVVAATPVVQTPPPVETRRQPEPEPEPEPALASLNFDEEEEEDESAEVAAIEAQKEFLRAIYSSQMLQWTNRSVRYPSRAERRGDQGRVVLEVEVDRAGNVLSAEVIDSSGHSSLDREAVNAAERASPYPRVPDDLEGATFRTQVPITFQLR
jgi:protein TonB